MSGRIGADARAPEWGQRLREEITRRLERLFSAPWPVKVYRIADLPDASRFRGHFVFVDDVTKPAWSDGVTWRYVESGAPGAGDALLIEGAGGGRLLIE
jgi:hypothetical protein